MDDPSRLLARQLESLPSPFKAQHNTKALVKGSYYKTSSFYFILIRRDVSALEKMSSDELVGWPQAEVQEERVLLFLYSCSDRKTVVHISQIGNKWRNGVD